MNKQFELFTYSYKHMGGDGKYTSHGIFSGKNIKEMAIEIWHTMKLHNFILRIDKDAYDVLADEQSIQIAKQNQYRSKWRTYYIAQ